MCRSKIKKHIAMLLAAIMAAGTAQVSLPVMAEETAVVEEDVQETARVSVYPTPQGIESISEEGMMLQGPVDIIIHGEQDTATLPKLEALLKEEGIDYEFKDAVGENAAIVLATVCAEEDCLICTAEEDSENALSMEQGYVLRSSNAENEKGQITIIGADQDGTYYGVMTLIQMFEQKTSDGRIAEVNVSDYPDVKFRGYVEGFYGIPWSFEDRAQLFKDTTLLKMTTYIYAPKDDSYHRSSWRTLYPEAEAANIQELAEVAEANNMDFCWTIHPGADYDYTTDADGNGMADDYETLLAKFEQVYSLGVRQFGIFYDDLSYSVANGSKHAGVINDAYAYLTEKYDDVKPFITVVTRYTNSWGAPMDTYFIPFMQQIHEDTIVLWTGNSTMSAITKDYMEWPQTNTGVDRDFGVWWNYPVNDYCNGHLLMSPLDCLSNDVDNICSFFLNPMSEADASKVAIYSGADYSWNITEFDSQESWSRAIKELVPEANEAFERFADNIGYLSKGNGFEFDESVYLKDELESFNQALASGEQLDAEIANMKQRFEQMKADAELLRTIENEALLEEITNHLDAYEAVANAGIACMEGFEAAMSEEIEQTFCKIEEMEAALEESSSYRTPTLSGSAQAYVCTYRIIPFLENMEQQIMNVLNEHITVTSVPKMKTNVTDIAQQEVVSEKGTYFVSDITATVNEGDYVAIALPKAVNLYDVEVETDSAEVLKLQYSLNGIDWKDWTGEIVTAAYARVICMEDGTDLSMSRFIVTPAYEMIVPSVSTDMSTYKTYTVGKALDGDLTTLFWSSTGSSDGNYIEVDMGAAAVLNTIQFYSGVNKLGVVDAYAATQLEVSMDGAVWTAVGEAKPLSDFVNIEDDSLKRSILTIDAEGVTARYFRLRAVGASDSWLMAYEILYDADYIDYENRVEVTTNMNVYQDYTTDKAMDGSVGSYLWCLNSEFENTQMGAMPGDYVQVDLGTIVPLYDASIYFGKNTRDTQYIVDGFSLTKLQVSTDGENWTDMGTEIAMDDYVESDGLYQVSFKGDGSLVRYLRFMACEEYRSWAKVYEVKYNSSIAAIRNASLEVSTDMNTYQSYNIHNAIDGDMDSKFYSSAKTSTGNYVQVDFGSVISLYDAAIYYGGSPNDTASAIDGFDSTKLQISSDGSSWTDIGEVIKNTEYEVVGGRFLASFEADGVSARYVRFTAASNSNNWCQVYEIQFNKSVDSNTVRYTGGTVQISQSDYLDDGKLDTSPAIYNVDDGDTLIYPMTTVTNVESIGIFQEAEFICNAQVSIENLDGSWTDIGTLDSSWNLFDINAEILSVKFTFDGSVRPVIYEIIVTGAEEAEPPVENPVVFEITKQPENVTVSNGEDAVVTVEATGKELSYTWYYKNPGNAKFYVSGSSFTDGSTYSIPMSVWRDGQQVYCVITDADGNTLTSDTVTLSLKKAAVTIVTQPKDTVVNSGETAVVTVEAEGEDLIYTWYYKNAGNAKFYVSGSSFADGNTYSITMNKWRDGQQVYCVITDAAGNTVQTDTVTLSMEK